MRKAIAITCIAVVITLALAASFLVLKSYQDKEITMEYPASGLSVRGEKHLFGPYTCDTIYVSDPASASRDLVIRWNHVPYPFSSMTISALQSLGFTVVNWEHVKTDLLHPVKGKQASFHLQKGKHGRLGVRCFFEGNTPTDFGFWMMNLPSSAPFSFTFRAKPEAEFPLAPEQVKTIFGPPDKITYEALVPLRSRLLRLTMGHNPFRSSDSIYR